MGYREDADFWSYFNATGYYEVVLDEIGLTVYSECCSDRMDLETAYALHVALGRWLDRHAGPEHPTHAAGPITGPHTTPGNESP